VLALAKAVLGNADKEDVTDPVNALDRLLSAINRSAAKRNAYIHDTWLSLAGDSAITAQLRLSGQGHGEIKEIEPKDLQQLATQARSHADALARWARVMESKLNALLEIHRKQQSLALALIRSGTPPKRS
jgi:hypothetical protein